MIGKLRKSGGYIVVETISVFILFVFLMVAILSLINIVTVQARVHYAVTQAAETISMYSYVLEKTGIADHMKNSAGMREKVESDAYDMKNHINDVISGIQSLASLDFSESNFDRIQTGGENAYNQAQGWVDSFVDDPETSMQMIMNYALGQGESELFERLLRPMVGHYLGNGKMNGDRYLKSFKISDGSDVYGVDGLIFSDFDLLDLKAAKANDSTILTSKGEVKIIVRYEVDYFFGILKPIGLPRLHITQEVVTRSWLGGKGEGYKG